MRVRLKGINRVTKKLADGSSVTYFYAWKGGPRLDGKPGTPEFHASYNAAVETRKATPEGVLRAILDAFEASSDFAGLAPRTRTDYKKHIKAIEVEFGDFPLKALEDRRTRGEFLAWRDRMGVTSRRNADYRFAVFARILAWAFNRGLVPLNPCERPGRLYRSTRSEVVWTDADEAAFLAKAPAHLHLALTLALWTGQRQGDLLRLTWNAYDGSHIRLKQQKTGARVVIPVGAPLKRALDEAKRKLAELPEGKPRPLTILATENGTPWTESGFRASWRKACAKAGVVGVTFHDLRGTAVTRLALAECSEAEIATITGHSLRDVGAILDSHYLKRDGGLADFAIRKLERRAETPN
ncbi:MAG: integrase [Proteobacteria bacterium SG_bin5]|nr:MAG: integrase [Proteobacteria bacterium SG_bin5]